MEVISAQEMRDIEARAIASGQVSGLDLMERAGRGVVAAVYEEWPEFARGADGASPYLEREEAPRAIVLCGPGNNGGDGFVVARLLSDLGWQVEVFFYGNAERLPPDARVNHDRWVASHALRQLSFPEVSAADVDDFEDAAYRMSGTDLIVDALFGIGLRRDISGLSPLFAYNDIEVGVGERLTPARHVAIDLPSGMRSDGGNVVSYLGWFLADLTVTFHAMKPAHVDLVTAPSCGKVVVKDIGL